MPLRHKGFAATLTAFLFLTSRLAGAPLKYFVSFRSTLKVSRYLFRALALLLALRHQLKHAVAAQAEKHWDPQSFTSLENTKVLIAGFGGIGKEIARRCAAFGAEIIAVKNHLTEEDLADRVITNDELMNVLPEADVVMCALPGTPETEGYFGAKEIAAMKKGVYSSISRAVPSLTKPL